MSAVAVLQSNYIPWKGYFDIIRQSDLFVFYDDVQYTKNDWRNRNKIKTSSGTHWLTIPTGADLNRLICEVELKDARWQVKHLKSLRQWYAKAPYFSRYLGLLEEIYLGRQWNSLSQLNQHLIRLISTELGLRTEFASSTDYSLSGSREVRLLDLLRQIGPSTYLSGPSAADYLDPAAFGDAGIDLQFVDYSGYPEYPQLYPPFRHDVSVLDVLFNVGAESAGEVIWGWRDSETSTN